MEKENRIKFIGELKNKLTTINDEIWKLNRSMETTQLEIANLGIMRNFYESRYREEIRKKVIKDDDFIIKNYDSKEPIPVEDVVNVVHKVD